MSQYLPTVIELHEAVTKLRAAEELLDGIPDWMQELHQEHSSRKSEIDELDAAIAEATQERRGTEGEINEIREKVKHFQEQISLVRNQREYGALLQEIDAAKEQIKGLEDLALAAMERQEEAESKLGEERQGFAELDARYAAELEKWEAQKPQVAEEAERLRGQVEVLQERLPLPIRAQYERISARYGGEALAEIVKIDRGGRGANMWHCGACNYRVRPQAVVQIQNHGTLEFCDTCKRILYLDEVTP
jgi:hypothetical protein